MGKRICGAPSDLRNLRIYMRTIVSNNFVISACHKLEADADPGDASLWCQAVGRWPVGHKSEFGDFIEDMIDCWFASV